MRRGLVHVLAWTLATGAAVTLSWWGVHTVLAGTAYDPPRALPLTAGDVPTGEPGPPAAPVGGRPAPTPSPPAPPSEAPAATPSPSRTSGSPAAPPRARPSASPSPSGRVKSYDTDGGLVVFDLGRTSASLVSATPGAGWSMQVWKTGSWIRVEFAAGADRVSVFCTWHDGPPRVEIGTY
ncbi:hypothetical protein ACIRPQ_03615 [Streptomyces sp. NPDC101213]|uniref:hypothetical protein n=1 Tax=Streptomyces sp. NPDC101213 TaxID=3366130 RepID=UPI003821D7E4